MGSHLSFKYRFNLQKRYFDCGLGLTSYVKLFIGLFGLASVVSPSVIPIKFVIIATILYLIGCYFLGRMWIKWGWYEAEQEVGNKYNLFVKQMRKKIL